jgi:hypothetical protein
MEYADLRFVTLVVTLGGRAAATLGVATTLAAQTTHGELGVWHPTPVLDYAHR